MFTGIVQSVGTVLSIEGSRFVIAHDFLESFEIGESIALNGMCATIVDFDASKFSVQIIKVSRDRTMFGDCKVGDLVNLERSAVIGARNSGHFVSGHIDQVGRLEKIVKESDFWKLRVGFLSKNRKFVIPKGSIALNGISLTVSDVSDLEEVDAWFEVSIIPHTWEHTNLRNINLGARLNLEFDLLGKYVLNAVQ